jgi:hypothetical protein
MQTGAGSEANVLDEADLMTSNMPPSSESKDYLLGIGDQLLYTQQNEFVTSTSAIPNSTDRGRVHFSALATNCCTRSRMSL